MGGQADGFGLAQNIGGRIIGGISALASLRGGGLQNYMLARERLLADPSTRAQLVNSPFTSGFFGIGQGAAPAGAGAVAQPADFVGPPAPAAVVAPGDARYLPTGGRWYPDVPSLAYQQQVKEEQDRSTMIGLTSTDPAIRTQSKLAIGVPLSNEEIAQTVGAGRAIVAAAGPGSQVAYKLPGGQIQIGSPYNFASVGAEEYSSYDAAAAAASQRPGYRPVPSGRGTWLLAPPPTVEQLRPPSTPPPVPGGGQPPPATLPPVPGGRVAPPAGAPRAVPAVPPIAPQAFTQGLMDRGFSPQEAAGVAGNVHVESGFRPGILEVGGDSAGLMQWRGDRLTGLQNYASATGRDWRDPHAQMDWIALERSGDSTKFGGANVSGWYKTAFAGGGSPGDIAARFGEHVERPKDLSATVDSRIRYAEQYAPRGGVLASVGQMLAPGSAEAAEPPPGATVERPPPPMTPPPPQPARAPVVQTGTPALTAGQAPPLPQPEPAPSYVPPGYERGATAPGVTVVPAGGEGAVGYPPPAPPTLQTRVPTIAPPAPSSRIATQPPPLAGPPPSYATTPLDPVTGTPVKTVTVTDQSGKVTTYDVGGQGDPEKAANMRVAGITDMRLATPEQIQIYKQQEDADRARNKMSDADVERLRGSKPADQMNAINVLRNYRRDVNQLLTDFPNPEDRAKYIGWLRSGRAELLEYYKGDPEYAKFKADIAPFQYAAWDKEKAALTPNEQINLGNQLPTSTEKTPEEFEARLQRFNDRVNNNLVWRATTLTMAPEEITADFINQFNDAFTAQTADRRIQAVGGGSTATPPPPAPRAALSPQQVAPPFIVGDRPG